MKAAHRKLAQDIVKQVNDAISPGEMSQEEAFDFLEEVLSDLEGRADALREQIEGGK